MSEKFKGFDHTLFVLVGKGIELAVRGGSITLSKGYYDHDGVVHPKGEAGTFVTYVKSRDKNGQDIPYRFKLNESQARLRVRPTDKDFYGTTQYAWLKNYPACEGSPYGTYTEQDGVRVQTGVLFRELNTKADAEVALKADRLRTEAQAKVLGLDDATLQEVAAILGHYGDADALMRVKVLEFAGKKPYEFNELMDSGDRALRALVRRGIAEGVLTQKGTMIFWESTTLGADEDAAISRLAGDPIMLSGLKEKLGDYTEPIEKKKAPGNPNWKKKKETVE